MSFLTRIMGRRSPADVTGERMEPPITAAAEPATMAEPGWLLDTFGAMQSRVATLPRVTPEVALRHATILACGSIIAGDLAKIPLRVMETSRQTGKLVPVRDHPLDYLLNVESTFGVPAVVTRFNLGFAFAIRGNGYAYAPRDGAGDPLLIEYIHNDRCNVLRDGRARFYDIEDGAANLRRVPARSMCHLRYMATDNWTGRSPIQVAAESIGLALAGQEAAARTASGTHLRGFVKMEDNFQDDETRKLSIQRLQNALTNPASPGIPVIGKEDDIVSLDLSAADQELLASRKFDREQIAAIYRVPPSKLQMLEFGVKANGQQQAIDYKADCLTHWGNMAQDFMELGLLTQAERRRGLHLVHDYDALMEATTKERREALARAIGGPWMTPDEGRASEGLDPLPDGMGARPYPPANMTRDEGGKKESDDDA